MMNEPASQEKQAAQGEPAPIAADASEPVAAAEAAAPVEELQQQLEAARAEVAEMRDRWQRAVADFSNYRRRQQFDQQEAAKYAAAPVLTELLPIVDNFERAFLSLPGELRRLTWIQGIFQVWQLLLHTLARFEAKPIDALHQPFDPRYHEAVAHEEGEGPATVLEVFQTGYTMHERVLRPALVKVGPKPKKDEDAAASAATAKAAADDGDSEQTTASPPDSSSSAPGVADSPAAASD